MQRSPPSRRASNGRAQSASPPDDVAAGFVSGLSASRAGARVAGGVDVEVGAGALFDWCWPNGFTGFDGCGIGSRCELACVASLLGTSSSSRGSLAGTLASGRCATPPTTALCMGGAKGIGTGIGLGARASSERSRSGSFVEESVMTRRSRAVGPDRSAEVSERPLPSLRRARNALRIAPRAIVRGLQRTAAIVARRSAQPLNGVRESRQSKGSMPAKEHAPPGALHGRRSRCERTLPGNRDDATRASFARTIAMLRGRRHRQK